MDPQSETWLRVVVQALPQHLWTCDAQARPTYIDPRMLRLLGIEQTKDASARWLERIHPDDRDGAADAWRQALATGHDFRHEHRLLLEDGNYRWFVSRGRPVTDASGRATYWVGALDDIHDIVQTRSALHAEQLRLSKMADASPQMLYSYRMGPDGVASFPYVSPSFVRTFRVDADQLSADGGAFFAMGVPEDVPSLIASVQVSAKNLSLWQHQWRMRVPERGEIWVEAHSMPVRDADGGMTWHGTLSDVTARRQYQGEIQALNAALEARVTERTQELESSNKELEAFTYSVSHDLREPLRAVNGFAQAVVEDFGDLVPPEAQRYLDAIRQGGLRMGRLIDDLLAFSRLSRQELRRQTVDVGQLVSECVEVLTAAEGARAKVFVGDLLPASADPALMRQVVVNLLGNAFKYSRQREAPEIHVSSYRDDEGRAVYSVRDNGTGFDLKHEKKLFQVFQRLHRSTDFEGTGVGLAIVHRIVSRHGGRVWVADAALDRGATFCFTLAP